MTHKFGFSGINSLGFHTPSVRAINYRFGFIGVGNMGGALAKAASRSTKQIILCDNDAEKASKLAGQIGCEFADIRTVAAESEYLFLGVKPQMMAQMLEEIKATLEKHKDVILVSMAAGLSIKTIRKMAGGHYKVIRIMPNIPVEVGEGEILYTTSENISKTDIGKFLNLMKHAGHLTGIDESLMDAGCSLSGCGPAFVYKFVRGLAQGGIEAGLDEETALALAIQTVHGAATMLEHNTDSLDHMIEKVCSPGGSTIEGVKVLNEAGMEDVVSGAVTAAFKRNLELGKA
ncbi:pyrroline-5-carboxylate reductase [Ruminococcus sp.]|uniref:pyrroline-5-carboxylate reductase n=1 Tax=Ruminococcus sp. TaxID=41978 RepID=UPI00388DF906